MNMPGTRRGQKKASDSLELGLQTIVSHHGGFWELNPRPLEKQYILLTTEPSPQPPNDRFLMMADQGRAHIYPLL